MRTFHIGGAAQVNEQSNAEAISDGTIEYRDMATIVDQRGRRLALSRSGELAIIDSAGRERASHKMPYGAQIPHKDGEKVKTGDTLAEWEPLHMHPLTEKQRNNQ